MGTSSNGTDSCGERWHPKVAVICVDEGYALGIKGDRERCQERMIGAAHRPPAAQAHTGQ